MSNNGARVAGKQCEATNDRDKPISSSSTVLNLSTNEADGLPNLHSIENHVEEGKNEEERRKKEVIYTYIHTFVRSLDNKQSSSGEPKTHALISVDTSLHRTLKFLAPFFQMTVSDLYAEGALEKIESLIPKLPENIQLSIVRQINVKQQTDAEILALKIDLAIEQLQALVKRVKASPTNLFLKDKLRKKVASAIGLAATSGNDVLKQLLIEARELLRGSGVV